MYLWHFSSFSWIPNLKETIASKLKYLVAMECTCQSLPFCYMIFKFWSGLCALKALMTVYVMERWKLSSSNFLMKVHGLFVNGLMNCFLVTFAVFSSFGFRWNEPLLWGPSLCFPVSTLFCHVFSISFVLFTSIYFHFLACYIIGCGRYDILLFRVYTSVGLLV